MLNIRDIWSEIDVISIYYPTRQPSEFHVFNLVLSKNSNQFLNCVLCIALPNSLIGVCMEQEQ